MPNQIFFAMHPPRFARNGRIVRRRYRSRRDPRSPFFNDEQRRIDDARAALRDLEREDR